MPRQWTVTLLVLAVSLTIASSAESPEFIVIVHPDNPLDSIDAKELSRIFLKKLERWPDGREIMALDLNPDVPARQAFSETVHGRNVASIQSYWQRQIFSGKAVPPVQFSSENDVIAVVADTPFAVGYVSASAALEGRVKVLELEE